MASEETLVQQDNRRAGLLKEQLFQLPILPPKDDRSSSTGSGDYLETTNPVVPPRVRVPARSKTGCWVCRTRKVKCDERRPVCKQCVRLGHNCDYSPRLAFRDDTPRILEQMQEGITITGSIWDCQYCQFHFTRLFALTFFFFFQRMLRLRLTLTRDVTI